MDGSRLDHVAGAWNAATGVARCSWASRVWACAAAGSAAAPARAAARTMDRVRRMRPVCRAPSAVGATQVDDPPPSPPRARRGAAPRGARGGGMGLVVAVRRQGVDGRRVVGLPGTEDRRREVRLVRRVGEVLGLQREPVALAVLPAARADERAVEEVAGVELDPGLGRSRSSARGRSPGRAAARPGAARRRAGPVEHPVVVVAAAEHELLVVARGAARRSRASVAEVERRAGHRVDRAGRDQGRVDRRVAVGVELQLVVVDRPASPRRPGSSRRGW